MNALGIAVVGEYIVRIYDQVRNRPKFIVDRVSHREAWQPPVDRDQEYQALLDEVEHLRRELQQRSPKNNGIDSNSFTPPSPQTTPIAAEKRRPRDSSPVTSDQHWKQ